jgi:hypothetical protein
MITYGEHETGRKEVVMAHFNTWNNWPLKYSVKVCEKVTGNNETCVLIQHLSGRAQECPAKPQP